MKLHRVFSILAVFVLLLSAVTVAGAQEPEIDWDAINAIPDTLAGELFPLEFYTMLHELPEGTTFEDVAAAYEPVMAETGWTPDTGNPPFCEGGINSLAWTSGETGFIVLYLPATEGLAPQLMTISAYVYVEETADEEGAVEEASEEEVEEVEEAAAGAEAIEGCPCCQPLQAGMGAIFFENHIGEVSHHEFKGPENKTIDVPAKQGETAGCGFIQLKPGMYQTKGRTDSGGAQDWWEIEVVAGEIIHIPLAYEGF